MYKGLQFKMSPREWLEEDIREIAGRYPETTMIQWVGANPFCLSFDRMKAVKEKSEQTPEMVAARRHRVMRSFAELTGGDYSHENVIRVNREQNI